MKRTPCPLLTPMLLLWLATGNLGCGSEETHASEQIKGGMVCAVLAHPDDETMISGTLSMLADKGFDIAVIYATSGDDGPDETGRGLYGKALAEVREQEAVQALQAIGIKNPPVFLGYPDGHVHEHADSLQQKLHELFGQILPRVVISFGPDGITGGADHQCTGYAADRAFNLSDSGSLLLHMAITRPISPFYATGVPVPRDAVDVFVKVSGYNKQRVQAVESHPTQFNDRVRSSYKVLVHTMRKEKFIVAANRDGDEWLKRCF
jgi:LmbE family N-acetylglucosaminyl deacetylase